MKATIVRAFAFGALSLAMISASANAAAPAARIGDPTTAGPIAQGGAPTVLVCNQPAATSPSGSPTVLIGGMPAVRIGDKLANGGTVISGCPAVVIGP